MKLIISITLCIILAACASPKSAAEGSERDATPAAVARRTKKLSAEFARIEREQTNPELRRAVHRARKAWIAYDCSRREGDAMFAAEGISFDADYYRLRHRLLDAQFAQIRHLQPSQ